MDRRFENAARVYWTPDRLQKVTGGRDLALLPHEAPWLLRVMGMLNADGSMSARDVPKYRQINHMLAVLRPTLQALTQSPPPLHILDACCGSSYLSLLLTWYFTEKLGTEVRVLGIDRNPKVIAASEERARDLGWQRILRFFCGDISQESWHAALQICFPQERVLLQRPHLLVALHACDTATDDALALGTRLKAEVIAVAPCCQGELARLWFARSSHRDPEGAAQNPLAILYSNPSLRRSTAAHVTDAMRMLLMEGHGYRVHGTEFVDAEHTPKNRILICQRGASPASQGLAQYFRFRDAMGGIDIGLASTLNALH